LSMGLSLLGEWGGQPGYRAWQCLRLQTTRSGVIDVQA
jgi:hypothetical protein